MGSNPLPFNTRNDELDKEDSDLLLSLVDEYQSLLDIQAQERKDLLEKIDELSIKQTNEIVNIDSRLEQFSAILLDIRQQLAALSKSPGPPIPRPGTTSKQKVIASTEDMDKLAKEVEAKKENLDQEVKSLVELLEHKKTELGQKDTEIEELNDRLDLLSDEKERLVIELENLNSVIDSWKNQLDVLQKLAASDPRYKVIAALKKHGILSDIQLAFTMGTSINQLRKYIEDLISLQLVRKSNDGRYEWIGTEFDPDPSLF